MIECQFGRSAKMNRKKKKPPQSKWGKKGGENKEKGKQNVSEKRESTDHSGNVTSLKKEGKLHLYILIINLTFL
jgi:hypothetical protein